MRRKKQQKSKFYTVSQFARQHSAMISSVVHIGNPRRDSDTLYSKEKGDIINHSSKKLMDFNTTQKKQGT